MGRNPESLRIHIFSRLKKYPSANTPKMEQNAVDHLGAWCLPSNSVQTPVQWAVVAQNTRGASYLFFVPLCATDPGERTFQQLRVCYQAATRTACQESWIILLLTRTVVGTAKIQWVNSLLHENHEKAADICPSSR